MIRPGRAGAAALLAGLGGAALVPVAAGHDAGLVRAHRTAYPAAEQAALRASGSEGFQAAYDAARDLQEALRASGGVSAECRPLRAALSRYAAGRVLQVEGVDRPSAADRRRGARRAVAARPVIARSAPRCRGTGGGAAPPVLAMSPADGEAFLGPVVARAPAGATSATLLVDGRQAGTSPVRAGRARFTVSAAPGRHELRVGFSGGGRVLHVDPPRRAFLLGAASRRAAPGSHVDPALAAALARATATGPRYRAAWVQDLSSGGVAGVDSGALFPAASTVKLGLMAGVLARVGSAPAALSPIDHDLRAIAAWSSNLATNRLLRRAGGTATARDGLRRLGALESTFPGEYLVGSELQPALPGGAITSAPPRVSRRVTSVRDLARMLFAIHATAVGAAGSRSGTGLSVHEARLLLGWLLASEQRGDNHSLVAPGAPAGAPIAQKNGWIRSTRLAAAIVYTPGGPFIVVIAAHDPAGVSLRRARDLGTRVAEIARR